MKYNLVLLVLAAQLSACSVKTSDLGLGAITDIPENSNSSGDGGSAKSPYQFGLRKVTTSGQTQTFAYAEAMNLTDGKVQMRFFTIPPKSMCNVSTFTDSSSYQTKFSYLRFNVTKSTGTVSMRPYAGAEYGSRGDTFGNDTKNIAGDLTVDSYKDGEFSGWMNLTLDGKDTLQGNFKVVQCGQTPEKLKALGLFNIDKNITLKKTSSVESYTVRFVSRYRETNYGPYQGYEGLERYVNFEVQINVGTPDDLELSFGGLASGNYLSAGNDACTMDSTGPATVEIVGNTVYFSQGANYRPFFCIYKYAENDRSGTIVYEPTTGLHTLTIQNRLGSFVGTF